MGQNDNVKDVEVARVDKNYALDMAISPHVAAVLQEVQGAMIIAKKFPRNYMECWKSLQNSCMRLTLAEKGDYSYPRGEKTVKGASVYLARVAAQCWKNIRYGFDILEVRENEVSIQGWAWDMEANNKTYAPMTFSKLIQRKNKQTSRTEWVTPDERDLIELVNRQGAKCSRNALLQLLPHDYIEDARDRCKKTIRDGIKDVKSEQKRLVLNFSDFGVNVEMLNGYVGTEDWTKDDIVKMQGVLNTLRDGHAKREDYFNNQSYKNTSNNNDKSIPGLDDETASPGNQKDHQGFEPITEKATPEFRKLFAEDKDDLILTFQIELENAFPKKEDIANFWKLLISNNIVSKGDETSINKQELVNAILTLRKNSNGNDQKEEVKKEPEPEPQRQKETPESIKAKRIQNLTDNKSRADLLKQATEDLSIAFKNEEDKVAFLQSLVSKKLLRTTNLESCHNGHLAHLIVELTNYTLNKKSASANGEAKQKKDNNSAQTEADF